jgi:ABC-type transport system substrate-binding protein
VNFAVDRQALVNAGLPYLVIPTDQYLPLGIPGFKDAHIYPLNGPDLARARKLAGSEKRTAVLYTCDAPFRAKQAQILVANLAAIGIRLEVNTFPGSRPEKKLRTKGEPYDITLNAWVNDGCGVPKCGRAARKP